MAIDCDPNALAALAKCFQCLPPATLQQIQAYLLCQIGNSSVITGGSNSVFSDVAGALPPTAPSVKGNIAINEAQNEMWFVNSSLAWQQIIAV